MVPLNIGWHVGGYYSHGGWIKGELNVTHQL